MDVVTTTATAPAGRRRRAGASGRASAASSSTAPSGAATTIDVVSRTADGIEPRCRERRNASARLRLAGSKRRRPDGVVAIERTVLAWELAVDEHLLAVRE